MSRRIALVTGGNRGIGFEVCRQLGQQGYEVLLTGRDTESGRAAAQVLDSQASPVSFRNLDVTCEQDILTLVNNVQEKFGRLDVLINNAGIFLDHDQEITALPLETLRQTLETNTFAPLRLCQAFLPLMEEQQHGRIVNVSSGLGQFSRLAPISSAYSVSKTALNALTIMLAATVKDSDILINACHPGWVRTEMGGSAAPLSVEEGADTIVWLATLPAGGPSGGFFQGRQSINW